MLRYRATQFRAYCATLRSPYVRWRDLGGFEESSMLMADNALHVQLRRVNALPSSRDIGRILLTPFNVWGGGVSAGVAWRSETTDFVWYIDETTLELVYQQGPELLHRVEGAKAFFYESGIKN
jgi:hypothetical protein